MALALVPMYLLFFIIAIGGRAVASEKTDCVVPPHPEHGTYTVNGESSAAPGQTLQAITINVSCDDGFGVQGSNSIFCTNGLWTESTPKCIPECGTMLIEVDDTGKMPWHVGIYSKTFSPYMQICGGTLVSNKIVISSAHCFWNEVYKQLPATQFAVAVGKLYRPWNSNEEGQNSDVKEIRLPSRFRGALTNFQDDISVIKVADPFEFNVFVRPACLNFDHSNQLEDGTKGKIAGWGLSRLTAPNGKPSQVLRVKEFSYMAIDKCIENLSYDFHAFITSDKICAETQDDASEVCKGDGGSGFVVPVSETGYKRYYLRGVVSTAPNSENGCNKIIAFTDVLKHEDFIKPILTEI